MLDSGTDRPPADVIDTLDAAGWHAEAASWKVLSGGRCNRLWTFRAKGKRLVCKLFVPGAATPMFRNDASAEALALHALKGTGLAPTLKIAFTCASGDALVYEFLERTGTPSVEAIARTLARLHAHPPPSGLRPHSGEPATILRQGDAMLSGLPDPRSRRLRSMRPRLARTSAPVPVFLHGDPVPANVIATAAGPCLIDWQCPALGDASDDLSIYLSPAMQHLYGIGPLDAAGVDSFLAAYGHAERVGRYQALAPAYHYRMAAFCLWKTQAGDRDYSAAADLEIACLEQLG